MSESATWTAAELREQGVDVGVGRSGAILRIDGRAAGGLVDEVFCTVFCARLVGLPRLRELNLAGCALSDRAATHLRQLASLRTLNLENAQVSVAAIEQLAELPELELLVVRGTPLPAERLAELRRRRIRVRIVA